MLRTAEEILKTKFPNADKLDWFKPIVDLINKSRKECIEECAERVRLCGKLYCEDEDFNGQDQINMTDKRGYIDTWIKPDKQSILKLIDELK